MLKIPFENFSGHLSSKAEERKNKKIYTVC